VFDIRLRTTTESTWKILKLDWKTPGIFFFQKSGSVRCFDADMYTSVSTVPQGFTADQIEKVNQRGKQQTWVHRANNSQTTLDGAVTTVILENWPG